MADYATKSDIKDLDKKIDKRFDDLMEVLSGFANDVNTRFDKVDNRLDAVESRLDSIESRLDKLEEDYARLLNTMDSFIARIDNNEVEMASRDYKMDRLERWIKQLAAQAKVELT